MKKSKKNYQVLNVSRPFVEHLIARVQELEAYVASVDIQLKFHRESCFSEQIKYEEKIKLLNKIIRNYKKRDKG